MASLHPFRALRPAPQSAAEVAAVPYDVVNTEEARQLAEGHPLSFLHVSRAEIELPPDTDPYADVVYETADATSSGSESAAPLVVEDEPSLYFYRLRMGAHVQTGLAACFSVDEYERRRHPEAREDAEGQGRRPDAAHRGAARADGAGVPDVSGVARDRRDRGARSRDAAAVRLHRGRRHPAHDLARAGRRSAAHRRRVRAAAALYIADGHHRAASAAQSARGAAPTAAAVARGRHVPGGRVSRTTRCRSSPTTGS